MNVHYLELFYYVARHGGISRAVRHMPYGIQQPAVSSQMLLLERDLGKRLFERTPFKLTPEGELLFAYVEPFFGNLEATATRLRQKGEPQLRIGASEIVLRDHLPHLLSRIQQSHPGVRITLRSGFQAEMEQALQAQEIDLAITPLETKPPPRIQCLRLVKLPLVLLVPKALKLKSAEALWAEKCDRACAHHAARDGNDLPAVPKGIAAFAGGLAHANGGQFARPHHALCGERLWDRTQRERGRDRRASQGPRAGPARFRAD
jgi:DNA-binding transcriptional LysR family regulator